ncbi:cytochrome c family protein [Novosphingobium sp. 9U]|uniref:c-type cytochrome n=1 Tax=Novosphingobium sp. 9U TaxID=2653158 RepID=UPI001359EF64|nr:cytochrome c [Novosphingobium sp. 9U]
MWLAGLLVLAIGTAVVSLAVLYVQTQEKTRTQAELITGGHTQLGKVAIGRYGCGSCHVIPGVSGANGQVGPDLTRFAQHSEIAGKFSNDPEALLRWLEDPQGSEPGSGMPNMGVTRTDARDIAAYLYSL